VAVLIDTSFLLALSLAEDQGHVRALAAMRTFRPKRIIAAPVLPELFYMMAVRVNYASAVELFARLQTSEFEIEPLTSEDMARMREIMVRYEDAAFDFVDVAVMALSERLHVTQVLTFDRRDFSIFRPAHCEYLELLP
jgi:predicted nucleic acid-binding protein